MSLSPPRDLTRAHGPVSRRWAGVRVSQMAPVSAHLSSDASAQSITYYSTRTHGYKRCRGEYEVIDRHLAEKKKKRNLLSLNFQSSVESVGRHELQSVSPYGEHKSVRMSWLHATCSSLTLFFFLVMNPVLWRWWWGWWEMAELGVRPISNITPVQSATWTHQTSHRTLKNGCNTHDALNIH